MFLSITWTTSDEHQALIFNHAPTTLVVFSGSLLWSVPPQRV